MHRIATEKQPSLYPVPQHSHFREAPVSGGDFKSLALSLALLGAGTMPGAGLPLCGSMAPGTAISIIHDLQSDFAILIDCNGTQVAKYVYDAWIKTLSTIVPTQAEDNMVNKKILYIQLASALANKIISDIVT